MTRSKTNDLAVILRAVPISSLFYGLLVLVANFILLTLFGEPTNFIKKVLTGIQLFLLWLIVTSTVRSLQQLSRQMPVVLLWVSGGVCAVLSVLVAPVILSIAANLGLATGPSLLEPRKLTFYLALGLVFSLIAIIHLRVRNKALGNSLEWLIIFGLGLAFFYYLK
jgi:hypothetical protein